ncbi:histidine phosphatase family protein [Roseomonas sp. CGMCC 1.13459]|uniref:histidine phosphatase family protein n=1 Tax=Roseomonas sp. CGMCC 1.13459 TaxID=3317349 RepID=UPI002E76CDC2|nr:histidine phosphatase family protein [Roseomonas oleicola]
MTRLPRRAALALPALLLPGTARAEGWPVLRQGGIVLFRHANAPGGGDPPGFRLEDCATQRNLDALGRDQARRIGATFRAREIAVGQVLTSRWCRARETAELAFPGQSRPEPVFDSFFANRRDAAPRTEAARALLQGWAGPGALVITTHQVNITALTEIFPASGEGIVLRPGTLAVAGRIRP